MFEYKLIYGICMFMFGRWEVLRIAPFLTSGVETLARETKEKRNEKGDAQSCKIILPQIHKKCQTLIQKKYIRHVCMTHWVNLTINAIFSLF